MASQIHRDCERECRRCGEWKHFSRFRSWRRQGVLSTTFAADCLDCEQKARNERKNKDRPFWILKERAQDYARKHGVSSKFIWVNMNWRSLLAPLRGFMTAEGLCVSCGHKFDSDPDIQLEHREPPRHETDYARMHARNIGISCGSCNRRKSNQPYSAWLDDQEEARISNQANPSHKQQIQYGWNF